MREPDGTILISLNDGWVKTDANYNILSQECSEPFGVHYKTHNGKTKFRSIIATIERIEGGLRDGATEPCA